MVVQPNDVLGCAEYSLEDPAFKADAVSEGSALLGGHGWPGGEAETASGGGDQGHPG